MDPLDISQIFHTELDRSTLLSCWFGFDVNDGRTTYALTIYELFLNAIASRKLIVRTSAEIYSQL